MHALDIPQLRLATVFVLTDTCFVYTLVNAMLQALLHCAKNSMNMLKNRIQSRTGGTGAFLFVQKPFFEVGFALLTAAPAVVTSTIALNARQAQYYVLESNRASPGS